MSKKYGVFYYSLGGNTKAVAEYIHGILSDRGLYSFILDISNYPNPETFDHVFIGSFTWGLEAEMPKKYRKYLRWMLKENDLNLPSFSVFGTGDTQWDWFCKSVDETEYHLSKYTSIINKLKIEQHPIDQKDKVRKFVEEVIN